MSEEKKTETAPIQIPIDEATAFQIKLQEFDKDIANAELKVLELKAQKSNFIYSSNVEALARKHQENMLRQQAEDEVKKKLANADNA